MNKSSCHAYPPFVMEPFFRRGQDPHSATGLRLALVDKVPFEDYAAFEAAWKNLNHPLSSLALKYRDKGKRLNIILSYQWDVEIVARTLGVSEEKAQAYIESLKGDLK